MLVLESHLPLLSDRDSGQTLDVVLHDFVEALEEHEGEFGNGLQLPYAAIHGPEEHGLEACLLRRRSQRGVRPSVGFELLEVLELEQRYGAELADEVVARIQL